MVQKSQVQARDQDTLSVWLACQ